MAIYTPRGLKIRIPVAYAFGLIARLYPQVKAYSVLKTAEALDLIPDFLSYGSALVCFALKVSPVWIIAAMVVSHVVGLSINLAGLYVLPGLVLGARVFSYVHGFGVLFVVAMVLGYIRTGWVGVVAYLVAVLVGQGLGFLLEVAVGKRAYAATALPLTRAEINFFNAYRLHAVGAGMSTDLALLEEELAEENWGPTFAELAVDWPEITARFTPGSM